MVSVIFVETLLNKNKYINKDNIVTIKNTLKTALDFFQNWYTKAQEQKNAEHFVNWEKSLLSMITYNNMKVCICGFIHFAKLVLDLPKIKYIPMLYCTQSSIESIFLMQST